MIHGNYYDKYRSNHRITRWLTNGFLAAWSDLARVVERDGRPESLLEAGCGDGYLLDYTRRRLNPRRITVGLEPGLPEIRTRYGLSGVFHAVAGSIYSLPFDDNSFDLVTVPEVFEHLSNPERGRKEVFRVARKYVIASVPWEPVWRMANLARGNYWKSFGNTPGHLQHYSRKRFIRFMDEIIDITDIRCPFPWTMVLGKVRKTV